MKTNQNTFTRPVADAGGKHRAAVGISTRDKSDKQREAEAVEAFNLELQRVADDVIWNQPF